MSGACFLSPVGAAARTYLIRVNPRQFDRFAQLCELFVSLRSAVAKLPLSVWSPRRPISGFAYGISWLRLQPIFGFAFGSLCSAVATNFSDLLPHAARHEPRHGPAFSRQRINASGFLQAGRFGKSLAQFVPVQRSPLDN